MKTNISTASKHRITEYDIIKGVCILFACISHTGHCVYFWEYGFLFAFFFVSGATFRRKPFWTFLRGKLQRIYVPFVLANFVGYFIGRYFYGLSGHGGYAYTLKEAAMRILSFQIAENIMSPSWFMLPLFLVTLVFWLLHTVLEKVKRRDEMILGMTFLLFLAGLFFREQISAFEWNKCAVLYSLTCAPFFCALGYWYHNYPDLARKIIAGKFSAEIFVLVLLLMTEIWSHYEYSLNVRYGETSSAKLTVVLSIMCVYAIVYLARCIDRMQILKNLFCFLGKHSMAIMMFHVVSFGAVTFALHFALGWEYPTTWTFAYFSEKIAYANTVAGCLIPAVVAEGFSMMKAKCLKLRKH